VRITSKGDIRRYSNDKGEGKLLNCDIIDEARVWSCVLRRNSRLLTCALACTCAGGRADAHGVLHGRGGQVPGCAGSRPGVPHLQGHAGPRQKGTRTCALCALICTRC
jgi:hypothetical protein